MGREINKNLNRYNGCPYCEVKVNILTHHPNTEHVKAWSSKSHENPQTEINKKDDDRKAATNVTEAESDEIQSRRNLKRYNKSSNNPIGETMTDVEGSC